MTKFVAKKSRLDQGMAISANLAKDLKLTWINVKLNLDNRLNLVIVKRTVEMNIVLLQQLYLR